MLLSLSDHFEMFVKITAGDDRCKGTTGMWHTDANIIVLFTKTAFTALFWGKLANENGFV